MLVEDHVAIIESYRASEIVEKKMGQVIAVVSDGDGYHCQICGWRPLCPVKILNVLVFASGRDILYGVGGNGKYRDNLS